MSQKRLISFFKPALAFGNSVIWKPANLTPAVALLFSCSQPNTTAAITVPVESATDSQNLPVQVPKTNATDCINPSREMLKNISAMVYKDANCGCCKEWISHTKNHGRSATGQDVTDLMVFKERYIITNNKGIK